MQAGDIMTRTVATVRPETTIAVAIATMVEGRISGLPVLDGSGRLVGILTEGDLLRRTEIGTEPHRPGWLKFLRGTGSAATDYVRARTHQVEDVMTPAPETVCPTAALDDVAALMERRRIRRVPVVDGGVLVGIVSRADLVRALGQAMQRHADLPSDDLAIRAAILAELKSNDWSSMCEISVSVDHGVVQLDGPVQSDAVRTGLRVAAERVPGVVAVENRVVVIDPLVGVTGF
jgi:CBS domain-containing protein